MSSFIPQIGLKGLYDLATPFDAALLPNVPYTCVAIRRLSDAVAAGGDPFTDYYSPVGISQADYDLDVANGVCLISLQTDSGEVVYVPAKYINAFPDINGIPYTALVLSVKIGAVPDALNLAPMKDKLVSTVLETLGIISEVKEIAISNQTIVPVATHEAAEAMRTSRIASQSTDYAKLLLVTQQRDDAYARIALLEQYIKDNHIP